MYNMTIGQIEIVNKYFVQGWGMYTDSPRPAVAQLFINHILVMETVADQYKQDFQEKHHNSLCGFFFDLTNNPLKDGDVISVTLSKYNEYLENSNYIYFFKKRNTCYIHVGMHKTGTSSIQESLYAQRNNINILYPELDGPNHSVPMFSLFYKKPEEYYVHKLKKWEQKQVVEYNNQTRISLEKQIIKSNHNNILISGEDLIYLELDCLLKVKNFFERFYNDIKIIIYLRPLMSYLNSAFQENLKNIGEANFNLEIVIPKYKNFIEKFINIFGKSNVNISLFSKSNFKNEDVVHDFIDKLNIDCQIDGARIENRSFTLEAIAFLYVFFKFYPETIFGENNMIQNQKLNNFLYQIGTKKFAFCENIIQPIFDKYGDDLLWCHYNLGIELNDYEPNNDKSLCISSEEDLFEIAKHNVNILQPLLPNKLNIETMRNYEIKDIAELLYNIRNLM